MKMKNEIKSYTVKKSHRGGYNYKVGTLTIFLEFDGEQDNCMVSGGFGMWKPYPVLNGEVLWSNPLAGGEMWCNRKKDFVHILKAHPEAVIASTEAAIEEHETYVSAHGKF